MTKVAAFTDAGEPLQWNCLATSSRQSCAEFERIGRVLGAVKRGIEAAAEAGLPTDAAASRKFYFQEARRGRPCPVNRRYKIRFVSVGIMARVGKVTQTRVVSGPLREVSNLGVGREIAKHFV